VLGGDADQSAAEKLDVLLDAADRGRDGRGIGGCVAARRRRLPNRRAVLFVEGNQGRLLAARRADQYVAVDQRRLGVGPDTGLAAEVGAETFLPAYFSLGGIQANHIAVGAEDVDGIAIDGRCGARSGIRRLLVRIADAADARGPDLFAVRGAQRRGEL